VSAAASTSLTIAIPFYRGQAYLREAIDSVLRQEHARWRLLVSDDAGPEPGTAELVRSYADERIEYHRNAHNLGMAGNWNRCLDRASTDLVTLLHADDQLLPNYASLMTEAAAADPRAAAFFCRARIVDAAGRPCFSLPDFVKRFLEPQRGKIRLEDRAGVEALLPGNFIMCPTLCYRRSVLGARRFSSRWQQVLDLDFYCRLLFDGAHLVGLPACAYVYRRHPENATARQTRELLRFREESELFDAIACRADERGWTRAARRARAKRIIKLHLGYQMLRDVCSLRLTDAGRKLALLTSLGVP
jgi:glycosyltransferase involved in cell wall biosynthesis